MRRREPFSGHRGGDPAAPYPGVPALPPPVPLITCAPARPDRVDLPPVAGLHPLLLAVNCRHIYWTNEDGNEIGRASLNGTGVNQKFITGADFPDAIAAGSQYLYWANAFGKTIGRA